MMAIGKTDDKLILLHFAKLILFFRFTAPAVRS